MKKTCIKISVLVLIISLALTSVVFTIAQTCEKKVSLTVSAAASLKDVMVEIAAAYKKEKPKIIINFNFGASGILQKQIEQGAPVDLFLSAGQKQMDALKAEKIIVDATLKNLLINKLVLITSKDFKTGINSFKDVINDHVKLVALGEPKTVPCCQYAEEVFNYFGILEKVRQKAVFGKDAREILTWVEQGNADCGVVYQTDAMSSGKVRIIDTAQSNTHSPIIYPGVVMNTSRNIKAATDYLNFLTGKTAAAIFRKFGFEMVEDK